MRRRAILALVLMAGLSALGDSALAQNRELRICLRAEPKTFDPLMVADDASETIRYLTGGVLIRLNRSTQKLEPELAKSWKVSNDGRTITLELREGLRFSDGTAFTAEDVVHTMRRLMDPELHSPTGDSFRSGSGLVEAKPLGTNRVVITFPAPVAGMERLFDQVAIMSARSPQKEMAVLGPFFVAEHKPGASLLLKRNPHYWKRDAAGRSLPYSDSVRLDIQQNRDLEFQRFRRGEIHLINSLDPEFFDRMVTENPAAVKDAGPSLDPEMMWFNQVEKSPIPSYKKTWFRSKQFRRAVSEAINRNDLSRVALRQHGQPGVGPVSPANRFWFNSSLKPHAFDPPGALRRLQQDGFRLDGKVLRDRQGNAVEFSVITNAGNKLRERIAAMVQQDLAQIGIKLNIVALDFPSLIERITKTFDYEACLLGLTNVDLDPNAQMNVWLSSSSNHQWNPNQAAPETPWEAEIDRLMRAQASSVEDKKRKEHFDRVQQIVWEEVPFIYLVYKNALVAVSPEIKNAKPVVLRPQTFWNIEWLSLPGAASGGQP
jgi:peptide/nickel transport system substrate-binding protein